VLSHRQFAFNTKLVIKLRTKVDPVRIMNSLVKAVSVSRSALLQSESALSLCRRSYVRYGLFMILRQWIKRRPNVQCPLFLCLDWQKSANWKRRNWKESTRPANCSCIACSAIEASHCSLGWPECTTGTCRTSKELDQLMMSQSATIKSDEKCAVTLTLTIKF
jgi:hypothetical protein